MLPSGRSKGPVRSLRGETLSVKPLRFKKAMMSSVACRLIWSVPPQQCPPRERQDRCAQACQLPGGITLPSRKLTRLAGRGTNKLWSNDIVLRGTWRSDFSGNGDPVQDLDPSQWRGNRRAIGGEIALPLLNGMVTPQ